MLSLSFDPVGRQLLAGRAIENPVDWKEVHSFDVVHWVVGVVVVEVDMVFHLVLETEPAAGAVAEQKNCTH